MNKKAYGPLTEPMFYVLTAFLSGDLCGIDIAARVAQRTNGRVRLGAGTLYTILAKFLEDGWIEEVAVEGRKRTYRLLPSGRDACLREIERLQQCLQDGKAALLAAERSTHEEDQKDPACGTVGFVRSGAMA